MNKTLCFINTCIKNDIEQEIKEKNLKDAILYSIENGKRWRPILFISMFETSNIKLEDFPFLKKIILFLEYIHSSSLILDDLPMMDNDDYRRDKLTLHKKFNESTSKLAALQLLLLAQHHIHMLFLESKKSNYFSSDIEFEECLKNITEYIYNHLGSDGLCLGQFIDLNTMNTDKIINTWFSLVYKKTSSLFILSFLLGFIFSRKVYDKKILEDIKKIGEYFGYIYQMIDDLEDYQNDIKKQYQHNILSYISKEETIVSIENYYTDMVNIINQYKIGSKNLLNILTLLKAKYNKTT